MLSAARLSRSAITRPAVDHFTDVAVAAGVVLAACIKSRAINRDNDFLLFSTCPVFVIIVFIANFTHTPSFPWTFFPAGISQARPLRSYRLPVPQNAQAAARAAFDNRTQPSEISDLFGGFFNRFMVVVRTRRKVEGLSWGATKKSVAGVMLRGYISTDPVRAAAYTAAALMLEAVPSGDIAESPIPPPYSVPRQVVAPAAAAAATPAAELAPIIGPNGPSDCVNTLSTPPAAATLISGTRNTVASTTKGHCLNTLTETTSPDHPGTSPTAFGENKFNNNNINTTTTKPVSLAMMPPPTGINRTRWAKQRYSRSGSGNDPTKGRPTTPSGLPRSMDTVGVGSSSSGIYDVPGGASIVPGVAPTTAAGAARVASGVAANPAPFSADQGAGAVGCCSSSGQHTSEDALETEAAADGIDWYGVMNILVPTAPNAATGEALDVDSSIYNSSPETLGSGNSVLLGIGIDPDVPVASETAAAATPSPVVAAARMGAAGVAMAASPDSALKPNVLVATAAEARASTAAGAASSPVAEGRNTGTGKRRRATGDEGGTENPRCDGGARKKARSRSVKNRA